MPNRFPKSQGYDTSWLLGIDTSNAGQQSIQLRLVIQGPSLLKCMALPSSRFLKVSPFSWQILCERCPWVSPGLCSYHLCSDHIGQDAVTWPHLTEERLENTDQLSTPKNHFTDQLPTPQNCLLKADERQREGPSFWLGLLDRWWCHLLM